MPDISKLSINQITTDAQWSLRDAVEGYARHGVPAICVWRHKLAECGTDEGARIISDHGLAVTGLCRGGLFTHADEDPGLSGRRYSSITFPTGKRAGKRETGGRENTIRSFCRPPGSGSGLVPRSGRSKLIFQPQLTGLYRAQCPDPP